MTVYIPAAMPPKKADRDFSSAQRYGPLEFIVPADSPASFTPGPALHRIRQAIQKFDPTEDYVAYGGGDPLALLLVGVALGERHDLDEFRYLRLDRERGIDGRPMPGALFYTPVSIIRRRRV